MTMHATVALVTTAAPSGAVPAGIQRWVAR
jgi:hypothetical protein